MFVQITFVCAIVTKKYKFDQSFKKWWYYEFDLNGECLLVFVSTFHGNKNQS